MKSILLAFLLCSAVPSFAQDSSVVTDGFRSYPEWNSRKVVATAIAGGILAGSLVSSYFDWWKDNSHPFWFIREGWFGDYSLGVDKVGHMYTSYFYFNSFRNILLWGGYDPSEAFWWAAGTTMFFAMSIEIGDGLSDYGFSFEDLSSNSLGLGYGMLQAKVPFMQNFNLKWSYVPREGYKLPPHFTDHYDAHTYWLCFNVHNLLPESLRDYWPAFLQLAVGYGVDDHQSVRKAAVGLDFSLGAISVGSDDLHLVQRTVDLFHLPAPAIRFQEHKEPTYHLLYFQ